MSGRPTFALDAVGGDRAPAETVRGAIEAVEHLGLRVLLVGPTAVVQAELDRQRPAPAVARSLEVVSAEQTIGMDEHPASAVRRKRDSSPVVCARLVKEGRAAGFVSAGNSGAAMAAALLVLGRVAGIERPAIAPQFPTVPGRCLIVDSGANVDCRASYLAQFAIMGSLYSERALGVARPRVGLLNIGEEETKGNQVTLEAHRLIKALGLNFVGNVEGKDVPAGLADVVVCDGFVGNVALKMGEGMGMLPFTLLKQQIARSVRARLGALLLRPAIRAILRHVDYEEYGGAAILGVAGVAIVAHGRSSARAIRSALRVAKQSAEVELPRLIEEGIRDRRSVGAERPAVEGDRSTE